MTRAMGEESEFGLPLTGRSLVDPVERAEGGSGNPLFSTGQPLREIYATDPTLPLADQGGDLAHVDLEK